MIKAIYTKMPDHSYKVMITKAQGEKVIWQHLIDPDDAVFLIMDMEEAVNEIRRRDRVQGL